MSSAENKQEAAVQQHKESGVQQPPTRAHPHDRVHEIAQMQQPPRKKQKQYKDPETALKHKLQFWENGPKQAHPAIVDSHDALEAHQAGGRFPCPKCGKRGYNYCPECLVPFTAIPTLPRLPFKVSVLMHHLEKRKLNTGVQLGILCPEDVDVHGLNDFPAGYDVNRTVVLFPSETAVEVQDIDPASFDRVVVIDSPWSKARVMTEHPTLAAARHVKLKNFSTCFWRYHTRDTSDDGVCTLEAVYFFLREFCVQHSGRHSKPTREQGAEEEAGGAKREEEGDAGAGAGPSSSNHGHGGGSDVCHCYDNTLWYFLHQHKKMVEGFAKKGPYLSLEERKKKKAEEAEAGGKREAAEDKGEAAADEK